MILKKLCIRQLTLHQFFVFNDDQTSQTCVVYTRKDGTYGLIVPE